jgi:hypothetical protein
VLDINIGVLIFAGARLIYLLSIELKTIYIILASNSFQQKNETPRTVKNPVVPKELQSSYLIQLKT